MYHALMANAFYVRAILWFAQKKKIAVKSIFCMAIQSQKLFEFSAFLFDLPISYCAN